MTTAVLGSCVFDGVYLPGTVCILLITLAVGSIGCDLAAGGVSQG